VPPCLGVNNIRKCIFKNLWNFAILSAILFLVHIELKIFENIHTSTLVYFLHPVKLALHKQFTKGDIEMKSQYIFLFKKSSFVHSLSRTYYALYPWVFWSETFTRHLLLCVYNFDWDLNLNFLSSLFFCSDILVVSDIMSCNIIFFIQRAPFSILITTPMFYLSTFSYCEYDVTIVLLLNRTYRIFLQ